MCVCVCICVYLAIYQHISIITSIYILVTPPLTRGRVGAAGAPLLIYRYIYTSFHDQHIVSIYLFISWVTPPPP